MIDNWVKRINPSKGMKMARGSTSKRLYQADLVLKNALQPKLMALLIAYSYDVARLAEGRALWHAARQALSERQMLYGRQQELSRQLDRARRVAYDEYKTLAQLVRAVLRDQPGLRTQLGLRGKTPRDVAGLLRASDTFFANAADPAVAPILAALSYTTERIAEIKSTFQTLREANEAREIARGATQQATQELHAALRALDRWMSQFRAVARVALRDKPQYLEQLGILVRS